MEKLKVLRQLDVDNMDLVDVYSFLENHGTVQQYNIWYQAFVVLSKYQKALIIQINHKVTLANL